MGEPCLFQQKVYRDESRVELRRFSGETTPVFQVKETLRNELLERNTMDKERQNWVLPMPDGKRKGLPPSRQ